MTKAKAKKSYTVMRELEIDFLSPVDRPAQEGATALFMKRDAQIPAKPKEGEALEKNHAPGVTTSVFQGHAHIIWLEGPVGETTFQLSDPAQGSREGVYHNHPYSLRPDGTIEVLFNDGHTHTVDPEELQFALMAFRKNHDDEKLNFTWPDEGQINKGTEMTEKKTEKSAEQLEKTVADLTKNLALNSILAGFTDAEKSHFATLDEGDKAEFVSKSAEDRSEDIQTLAKAKEADDPVVYKSTVGDVYRKSDDPRMVRSARQADKAEKRAVAAEKAAADVGFSKRAGENLSHLPGTTAQHAILLKAIDGMEDPEDQKSALAALKASDEALSGAFKSAGSSQGVDNPDDSNASKLDTLAKKYAKSHDGVTEAAAYVEVLATDEGKALYTEMQQQ